MIGSGGAILKCAHGDVLPTSVEAAESAKPRRGDGVISVDAAKTKTSRASRPAEAVVVKTPLLAVRRRRDWIAGRRNVMVFCVLNEQTGNGERKPTWTCALFRNDSQTKYELCNPTFELIQTKVKVHYESQRRFEPAV